MRIEGLGSSIQGLLGSRTASARSASGSSGHGRSAFADFEVKVSPLSLWRRTLERPMGQDGEPAFSCFRALALPARRSTAPGALESLRKLCMTPPRVNVQV